MALDTLAEAIVRVEHKVDMLIRHFKLSSVPMHFPGQTCPICGSFIDYQIDIMKSVVVRKCQCSTGKVAPTIPLVPVTPGSNNGQAPSQPTSYSDGEQPPAAKDRRKR